MTTYERAKEILAYLRKHYHEVGPFVKWSNRLELLIATVLSAQCTDRKVNEVTATLFPKYRTAHDYANADLAVLEREVWQTGFYRSKAKYLKGIGRILVDEHGGEVPDSVEKLLRLPGVAKKTAYLVLAKGFGKNVGVAVDTHVKRVAPRLGLTKSRAPDGMSRDLAAVLDAEDYLAINEYLITHGRAICKPKPLCGECPLKDICPSAEKFLS
jgi:endonuclease III